MNLEYDGDQFKEFNKLILDCIFLQENKILQFLNQSISSEINFTGSDANISLSIAATFWDKFPGEFNKLLKAIEQKIGDNNIQYIALKEFINELDNKGTTNKLEERSKKIKLTWELLQAVCQKSSKGISEDSESKDNKSKAKYNRNTYLQRQEALEIFKRFLDSKKVGFILTGKSGVGKSNFIMSLLDEYSQDKDSQDEDSEHPKVCLLIYNAKTLDSKKGLDDEICSDFNKYPEWISHSRNNTDKVNDLWNQINQIEDIQSKKLILVIDAINENSNPKILFEKIHYLIDRKGDFSWLKVVVTCRLESWNLIYPKSTLPSKNYYEETANKNFSFELKRFRHLLQQNHSEKSELEEVYNKYKKVYNLKSNYSDLSFAIRELIRDPLFLRLISFAYTNNSIPYQIKPLEIYQKYISQLLEHQDLFFLRNQLIPEMFKNNIIQNYISLDDINQTLYDRINNTEILSNGETRNQSFKNLCDVGILEKTYYKIYFKLERVYEYFVSDYLIQLDSLQPSLTYEKLIAKVSDCPWLWGVIKQALVKDLKNKGDKTIIELAYTEAYTGNVIVKNIIVSALQEYAIYEFKKDEIDSLLQKFIKYSTETKHGPRQRKADSNQLTLREINIRRIAIEVAYRLRLTNILIEGAQDSSSEVRSIAIQYIWYLYRKKYNNNAIDNQQENKEVLILEEIRTIIIGIKNNRYFNLNIFVPIRNIFTHRNLFGSFLRVSLLLWFENYNDTRVMLELKEVWRPIFVRFFLVEQPESSVTQGISQGLQLVLPWLIQRIFVNRIMVMLKPSKESESWLNTDELSQFFNLEPHYKKIYSELIPYFDTTYGELNNVDEKILKLAECRTVITWYFLNTISVRHTAKNPQITVPLLKKVVEKTIDMYPLPPAIVLVRDAFRWAFIDESSLQPYVEDYTNFLQEVTLKILNKHNNFIQLKNQYIYSFIEVYHYFYFRVYGEIDKAFNQEVIKKLREKNCPKMYKGFLCDDLPYALKYKSIPSNQVLELLKPFLPLLADENGENQQSQEPIVCEGKQNEVKDLVIESLSMIRAWEPEVVDNFLFENEVPNSTQARVKDNNIYNFNNYFSYQLTKFGTEALVLKYDANSDLNYDANSDFIRKAFTLCCESSSLEDWLSKLVKLILNDFKDAFKS